MHECKHERTTALLDGVSCDNCGAFKADWGWGVASGKWFGSRALADFYMRNGKSPEPQVDDRIAALETTARECLGWIRHWQADVAGNLKPTPDSLAMMEAKLVAILEASR